MTFAQQFVARWRDDTATCDKPVTWAKEIDPKCRVEGFLYTGYQRFIFSDTSRAVLSNGCLKEVK